MYMYTNTRHCLCNCIFYAFPREVASVIIGKINTI